MFVLVAPKTRWNQSSTSPRSGACRLGWYILVTRKSDMLFSLFVRLPWFRLLGFRTGDTKVLAQGRAGVVPAEDAARLEFGHHHPDNLLEGPGQVSGREHEAVAGTG